MHKLFSAENQIKSYQIKDSIRSFLLHTSYGFQSIGTVSVIQKKNFERLTSINFYARGMFEIQ